MIYAAELNSFAGSMARKSTCSISVCWCSGSQSKEKRNWRAERGMPV